MKSVSVVVPTYKEAASLARLLERVAAVRREHDLDLDLIISDDNSNDGSAAIVASAGYPWVQMLVRTADRGLSPAVLDGLRLAQRDWLVVMDADLSHPPEKIPELLEALESGADFVLGSRYVAGGSTDAEWGVFRWLNSAVATIMARPFSPARDPMSGFFGLRRETFQRGEDLNPIGYKIALELLVKCRCRRVAEVPIHFADRQAGESKLSFAEQVKYLLHLRRLLIFKYPDWSYMLQFAVVGGTGTVVNLIALTALMGLGLGEPVAVAGGIGFSFLTNFFLNRRYTFSYARGGNALTHFLGFAGASAVGLVANYSATMFFHSRLPSWPIQIAAVVGILCGMGLNFVTSRYLVFRKPKLEPRDFSVRP